MDAALMFFWILVVFVVSILLRVLCMCLWRKDVRNDRQSSPTQALGYTRTATGQNRRVLQQIRIDPSTANTNRTVQGTRADRQGNVYTGSDDRANNRYGDIYFIEPNSEEAARIREQLEKDDKELPSYDEVMRMCNLTSPTPAPAAVVAPALPSSTDGVAISVAALPAPPYVEVDPNAQPPSITPSSVPPQCTVVSLEPSTSRAAQTTTSSSVIMTLSQTASNTEV
ncbi:uncharacterized protein LOC115627764 isoform X1 [Scaptodrosophila lebanonensis]|uniref:Uncharacterized protein LOC115627764 isoform X1 n=1 Tax=Drosophila lebanonensis TaxID=7225 RepID=A0A6J2TW78_DROLE|nr:uncharacterized protein LOC115627764 isoform X1 [Scaptodrosophila lebanonensis]